MKILNVLLFINVLFEFLVWKINYDVYHFILKNRVENKCSSTMGPFTHTNVFI